MEQINRLFHGGNTANFYRSSFQVECIAITDFIGDSLGSSLDDGDSLVKGSHQNHLYLGSGEVPETDANQNYSQNPMDQKSPFTDFQFTQKCQDQPQNRSDSVGDERSTQGGHKTGGKTGMGKKEDVEEHSQVNQAEDEHSVF